MDNFVFNYLLHTYGYAHSTFELNFEFEIVTLKDCFTAWT